MDIAILIIVIVTLLLLGIITFFTFQIWIHAKESKIQMANFKEELKNSQEKLNEDVQEIVGKGVSQLIQSIEFVQKEVNSQSQKIEENIQKTSY